MDYANLVAEFGAHYGMGNLAPDENGAVGFEVDGHAMTLQQQDGTGAVVATLDLVDAPDAGAAVVNRLLMQTNHVFGGTAGATLSVNPEGGWVYLCRQFSLDALDVDGFADGLEGFLNTLAAWRTFVAEYRARPEEAATGTHGDASALAADFLRV